MLDKFKLRHFPVHEQDYFKLVALANSADGARQLHEAAIQAIKEGNINLVFGIFKYDLLYQKLLSSPNMLQEIMVAIPPKYDEYFVLNILSQSQFIQALLNTASAPAYIKNLAKAHPVIQTAIFEYLDAFPHHAAVDHPLGKICKALLHSQYAAECIAIFATLNRKFAEVLFENYYTQANPCFSKMLDIIAESAYSIELLINIIQAHNIDFYIKRVSPQYTVDFCGIKIEAIYKMIFNAFARAYVEHHTQLEQSLMRSKSDQLDFK